jgi:DUF1680 family protein
MPNDYPIQNIPFNKVEVNEKFWKPRLDINTRVTIWDNFEKCEQMGQITNFEKAAHKSGEKFVGLRFNDSDLYKIIEAAAYRLKTSPDPVLERYIDSLIELIAASQWPDGYLNTYYTLGPEKIDPRYPEETQRKRMRWTNLRYMHELYCAGHFIEAAVAYSDATGKKRILEIARRLADHIDSTFGWEKKRGTPGHEEIELALCRLYRATHDERYLNLAKYFIDQRGHREGRGEPDYGEYAQDHKPVTEQSEAVGHAVRAGYLYTGMAKIAALTGDKTYLLALDRIWENVADKKLYITGGVGAKPRNEAYGANYELPNKTAYNETCAAIANIFWNQRMFQTHGESKYIDVLERTLYNGFLSGISLSGDEYIYSNPLEADGVTKFNRGYPARSRWFDCACCPPNIARLLATLPGYIYAKNDETAYINLYVGSKTSLELRDTKININQTTDYPWKGTVRLTIDPEHPSEFTLAARIPCWAQNSPTPSNLYRYIDSEPTAVTIRVNNRKLETKPEKGYAKIHRTWEREDTLEIELPMRIHCVVARDEVEEDRNHVAIERGPLVYCAESIDNNGSIDNLVLTDESELRYRFEKKLLNGVGVIRGSTKTPSSKITMIPYYAWSNRGKSAMKVWLSRRKQ